MMHNVVIDGNTLTFDDCISVARYNTKVKLSATAVKNVDKCRKYVDKVISKGEVVYGLTTGFGKFSNVIIDTKDIDKLQENLILSHAVSVGKPYSVEQTRAIMLLRANVLAKGFSGIKLQTLQTLIDMLNLGIHPLIPSQGSVGASGDLSPLSHLALVIIGKGQAEFNGKIYSGKTALKKAGLQPVKLAAKEGLALNNGTQVMTAVGLLSYLEAESLVKSSDIVAAMTIDAMKGTTKAFHPLIHNVRPHKGQITSAQNILTMLQNSPLMESHRNCGNVQDPYSLRCTPQVHGAVRDAMEYVRRTLEIEINAATDNPLIFPDAERVISGGNFHGEPLAIALDTLAIAISEIASISERRIEQMLNPNLNRGLPAFLSNKPGLDSGFMIAQLTAASVVSENKVLSHPASVDTIPTSANQEDHVSMGSVSANKVLRVVDNVNTVLAIELMVALQALDYRKIPSSMIIENIRKAIRKSIPTLKQDRILYDDINFLKAFLKQENVLKITSETTDIQ